MTTFGEDGIDLEKFNLLVTFFHKFNEKGGDEREYAMVLPLQKSKKGGESLLVVRVNFVSGLKSRFTNHNNEEEKR